MEGYLHGEQGYLFTIDSRFFAWYNRIDVTVSIPAFAEETPSILST